MDERSGGVYTTRAIFPSLIPLARKCADMLDDPDALQKVMLQVLGAKDVDSARSDLLAAIEEKVV